jgi:hypothetical protein
MGIKTGGSYRLKIMLCLFKTVCADGFTVWHSQQCVLFEVL